MEIINSFTAAVRGYHYYRRFWKPVEGEKLKCMYEANNAFDRFAIKVVKINGETVGHLPREISRITKFFLDRGASIEIELTSKHYRRSPLVQGGIEIACLVIAKMPATLRNTKIAEKYLSLVKEKYTEPKEEEVLGTYVDEILVDDRDSPKQKRKKKTTQKKSKQHDIRQMFARRNIRKNTDVIEIDCS